MTQELQWLASCGRHWAEQRAQMALSLADARGRGDINDNEYQELLHDLIRTDRLESEADDLQTKTMLVTAISVLSNLA